MTTQLKTTAVLGAATCGALLLSEACNRTVTQINVPADMQPGRFLADLSISDNIDGSGGCRKTPCLYKNAELYTTQDAGIYTFEGIPGTVQPGGIADLDLHFCYTDPFGILECATFGGTASTTAAEMVYNATFWASADATTAMGAYYSTWTFENWRRQHNPG